MILIAEAFSKVGDLRDLVEAFRARRSSAPAVRLVMDPTRRADGHHADRSDRHRRRGPPPRRSGAGARSMSSRRWSSDAWTTARNVVLGAAWVRRRATSKLQALSAVCPHLGCAVGWERHRTSCARATTAGSTADGDAIADAAPRSAGSIRCRSRSRTAGCALTWVRYKLDTARGSRREGDGSRAHRRASATRRRPGPSFAYVFGWSLVMLLARRGGHRRRARRRSTARRRPTRGPRSPTSRIRCRCGWLVRGLHFHGAPALVIVARHPPRADRARGAYKKPRELSWWLGILLLLLVLGFAITATCCAGIRPATGRTASRSASPRHAGPRRRDPQARDRRQRVRQPDADAVLRAARDRAARDHRSLGVIAHVVLARRHGVTRTRASRRRALAAQSLRDVIAMAVVFALLVGYVVAQHGADLAAPADPSAAYDARPLWYFRWLFELRHLAARPSRSPRWSRPRSSAASSSRCRSSTAARPSTRKRLPWIGGVVGLFAVIGVLTIASFGADCERRRAREAPDARPTARRPRARARREVRRAGDRPAGHLARRRRCIARARSTSSAARAATTRRARIARARSSRPATAIATWLVGFLKAPSGDAYWGHTKLAKTDDAMKPVELSDSDLDDLVELLYAQSGASDVDRGQARPRQGDLRQGVHRLPRHRRRRRRRLRARASAAWAAATGTRASSATRSRRSTWAPTRARCRGSTRTSRSPTATRSPSTSSGCARRRSATSTCSSRCNEAPVVCCAHAGSSSKSCSPSAITTTRRIAS